MEAIAKPVFVTEKEIKLDDGTTATYTGYIRNNIVHGTGK
jgi:hypothetical protein